MPRGVVSMLRMMGHSEDYLLSYNRDEGVSANGSRDPET